MPEYFKYILYCLYGVEQFTQRYNCLDFNTQNIVFYVYN